MNRTTVVPVSLPKDLAKELDKQARKESMTRSEYVRNILRRQLSFARLDELREEISKRAKKAGIRTLQDAVKAVRELRNNRAK